MDALLAQRHTTDKKVKMFENCGRNFIGKVGKLLNVCWSSSSFFPTFCFVTVFLFLISLRPFSLRFIISHKRRGHETKGRCAGRTVYVLRLIANPLVEIFLVSSFLCVSSSDGRGLQGSPNCA